MSLLDDLRNAGNALDIQFQPSSNEVQKILGALVHYAEHGKDFLTAAESGVEDVVKLLAPQEEEPATAGEPAAPASTAVEPAAPTEKAAPLTDTELESQIADLQAQLASRQATAGQTTADAPAATAQQSHGFGSIFGRNS